MLLQRRKKSLPLSTARSHQSWSQLNFCCSSHFPSPVTSWEGKEASCSMERLWKKSEKITITRQIKWSTKGDSCGSGIFQILEGKGGESNNRKLEWKLHFPLFLHKRWTFLQNAWFQDKGCTIRCWFHALEILGKTKPYNICHPE